MSLTSYRTAPSRVTVCAAEKAAANAKRAANGPPEEGHEALTSEWVLFPAARKLQCLAATYSSSAFALVPSALPGFTSEFEMGSGGSQAL